MSVILAVAILVATILFAAGLLHYLFLGPGSSKYWRDKYDR